jgi:pyruvate dehydrogenase E2 component (dihydrolipoamide acetyltransferase)
MAEIVRMPKLSDTMTEGVVAEWHKKVGDEVKSGELLAEIETDKATMEFESFQDGVLLHIGVQTGKSAPVDSILAILGEKGEDVEKILKEDKESNAGKEEEKKPEKEKSSESEEKSEKSEPAKQKSAPSESRPAASSERKTVVSAVASPVDSNGEDRIKASPLARKMAEDKGINLTVLRGTGDGGRVVKRDIEQYGGASISGIESSEDFEISQMRKTIARRLSESKFTAPHFYLTIDLDMDNAISARESINKAIAPAKISYNDLVVKAAAMALRQHPQVNASWMDDHLRFYKHVHVGVAVAVDEGLLVPVVRFADDKTLTQIGAEVKVFAEKARNKKLQPQDWEGNTFTISNLGMFGIEEFTAIINTPDSCILAVGAIRQTPVVKNGQVVPGNRMKVTLSCDHRVVDGAIGAAFLDTFRTYMENPVVMLGANNI